MGRPTKLTPETQAKIIQAIRLGATYELASAYGGITYKTFSNWMNKGEKSRQEDNVYFLFFHAVKEAEGDAVVGWLAKIEKAASDGSWQAAAWKLERRYPGDYGRQQVDHKVDGKVQVEVTYADYNPKTS